MSLTRLWKTFIYEVLRMFSENSNVMRQEWLFMEMLKEQG